MASCASPSRNKASVVDVGCFSSEHKAQQSGQSGAGTEMKGGGALQIRPNLGSRLVQYNNNNTPLFQHYPKSHIRKSGDCQ